MLPLPLGNSALLTISALLVPSALFFPRPLPVYIMSRLCNNNDDKNELLIKREPLVLTKLGALYRKKKKGG